MKKNIFLIFLVFSIAVVFANSISFKPKTQAEDLLLPELKNEKYLVVTGEGFGITLEESEESALKYALYTAVGIAVRSYTKIDTQLTGIVTEAMNSTYYREELEEEIIAYTNAYVHDYRVINTVKDKDGMYHSKVEAEIDFYPLDYTLIRVFNGMVDIDFSNLINKWEQNRNMTLNSGKMLYAILKEYGVPRDLLKVTEVEEPERFKKDDTNGKIRFKFKLKIEFDQEKYTHLKQQLEKHLESISPETTTKMTKLKKEFNGDKWETIYISDLARVNGNYSAIHFFEKEVNREINFKSYFLDMDNERERFVFEALEDYYDSHNDFTLTVLFKDKFKRNLYEINNISITESGYSLQNPTAGFSYSAYLNLFQYFFCPKSLRVENGVLKMSEEILRFDLNLEVPEEILENVDTVEFFFE